MIYATETLNIPAKYGDFASKFLRFRWRGGDLGVHQGFMRMRIAAVLGGELAGNLCEVADFGGVGRSLDGFSARRAIFIF